MISNLIRGATSLLAAGALLLNIAHVAAQPPPGGGPPGGGPGGPGGFPGFSRKPQQPQGFENMAQDPAKYTPEQKAAADVALRGRSDTNRKDLADQMAMVDDEIVYRGDPAETLGHGARGFCSSYNFTYDVSWERYPAHNHSRPRNEGSGLLTCLGRGRDLYPRRQHLLLR